MALAAGVEFRFAALVEFGVFDANIDVAFDELLENPFFNVNRPEDLILAEQLISQ